MLVHMKAACVDSGRQIHALPFRATVVAIFDTACWAEVALSPDQYQLTPSCGCGCCLPGFVLNQMPAGQVTVAIEYDPLESVRAWERQGARP